VTEPLLVVRGLCKAFGGVRAVDGVSFEVLPGELRALIGPNGAGKTTLFNLLTGQLRPDAGSVGFRGRRLDGLPPHRIWRHGISRTFQITAAFGSLTALENVQAALLSHAGRRWDAVSRAARHAVEPARGLLAQVGLAEQAREPAAALALGDVKRLELAVALASEPALLLLDEPTAGMAPAERADLMTLVVSLVRGRGVTVLFTEHDMDVVFGTAERILVLHQGRVIAEGPPEAVRQDAEVQAVYLGEPEPGRARGTP
jgi:branched-chain amino acid transport system ATP-binding protein